MTAFSFLLHILLCSWTCADHRSGQHWARTTKPMVLGLIKSVDNSGGNDWLGNWDWALRAWSQLPALHLATVPGQTDYQTRLDCPAEEGYIRVCNNDYGQTGWRGIAKWNYNTYDDHEGLIYQCTVKLNDISQTDYEKKWLCHEIGHCLGLDHTSTDGGSDNSCMDYSVAPTSIGPGQVDYDVLGDVYDHIDWFDSYAFVNQDLSCLDTKLAQVAQACDCNGPQPNQAWVDEDEYEKCLQSAAQGTGCDLQAVLLLADCLPFDLPFDPPTPTTFKVPSKAPTKYPTKAPTLDLTVQPSNAPTHSPTTADTPTKSPTGAPTVAPIGVADNDGTCDPTELAQVAKECDCFGPIPTQAWAIEDEYLQCMDRAAKDTVCDLQAAIDLASCLPLDPPAAMPIGPFKITTASPTRAPTISPISQSPSKVPTKTPTLSPTKAPTNIPTGTPIVAAVAITDSPTKALTKGWVTKAPTNECSAQELEDVSSICSCDGKNHDKPWKSQREYEKCVKKAVKRSDCAFNTVLEVSGCLIVFREASSPSSKGSNSGDGIQSDTNVQCEVYLDQKECKKRKKVCKWKKREELCIPKDRRLHSGTNLLRAHQRGRTYVSSQCHSPSKFGIPEEAILVMASDRSCKYEMRSEGNVEVIDVLL